MFGTLVVAVLLCAQGDVKLAAPGLSKLGISQEQANFYGGHLVARLASRPWLKVVSSEDIGQVLGLERQKELLGCADGKSSCVAELAGALGVDGLVTGQVARVGKSFQVNVKVIDPEANTLFVYSSERLGKEEELLDELDKIASLIAARLEPIHDRRASSAEAPRGAQTAPPPTAELRQPQPSTGIRWPPLLLAGAGVVVAGASAVAWVNVKQNWDRLHAAAPAGSGVSPDTARGYRDAGTNWQLAGAIAAGAGAAMLVGGLLWYFLGAEPAQRVALGADGHRAWLALTGAWP